jgi:hypothetical protein
VRGIVTRTVAKEQDNDGIRYKLDELCAESMDYYY